MKLLLGELPLDIPVDTDLIDLAASRNEAFLYQGFAAVDEPSSGFGGTFMIAVVTAREDTIATSEGWMLIDSAGC